MGRGGCCSPELPTGEAAVDSDIERKEAAGLKHRGAGRGSNRAYGERSGTRCWAGAEEYSGAVREALWPDAGGEHLDSEDGCAWRRRRCGGGCLSRDYGAGADVRRRHRRSGSASSTFGELVQMDGSFHAWAGGARSERMFDRPGGRCHEHHAARLGEQETIWRFGAALRAWIERYGCRCAVRGLEEAVSAECHSGGATERGRPLTQFGGMCRSLGIEA